MNNGPRTRTRARSGTAAPRPGVPQISRLPRITVGDEVRLPACGRGRSCGCGCGSWQRVRAVVASIRERGGPPVWSVTLENGRTVPVATVADVRVPTLDAAAGGVA